MSSLAFEGLEIMLRNSRVATRIPAQNLERARRFYAEKLGLEPIEERPGGLRYQCGDSYFVLFQSSGTSSGSHTQMAWQVDDIDETVRALRSLRTLGEELIIPGTALVAHLQKRLNAQRSAPMPSRGTSPDRSDTPSDAREA
jgi:catechol 2,3-dioxygenase-like lactoylglutathione lyase family enzyme